MYKLITKTTPEAEECSIQVKANTMDIKDRFVVFSQDDNPAHPVYVIPSHMVVSVSVSVEEKDG